MKKMLFAMIMVIGMLVGVASAAVTDDTIEDKSAVVIGAKSMVAVYDRKEYSVKNQNEGSMAVRLNKNVCSSKDFKRLIDNGFIAQFIYLYSDGTLMVEVTDCN